MCRVCFVESCLSLDGYYLYSFYSMSVQRLSVGRGNEPRFFIVSALVITIHCLYCSRICFPVCILRLHVLYKECKTTWIRSMLLSAVFRTSTSRCSLFASAASQTIDRLGRSVHASTRHPWRVVQVLSLRTDADDGTSGPFQRRCNKGIRTCSWP